MDENETGTATIKGGENKFSLTNPSTGYHYAYKGGYVIRPDHTHSYTYSGSGAVITEKCDCGHNDTATISSQAGYAVYRVHNNAAESMKANPGRGEEEFKAEGRYITIYAQKFSTYAIGYTESSGNNNNSNSQASGGGGSSTPVYPSQHRGAGAWFCHHPPGEPRKGRSSDDHAHSR